MPEDTAPEKFCEDCGGEMDALGGVHMRDCPALQRYGPERWMVDYEHAEGEPQHAVLSWLSTDPTTRLPDAGTELVKLEEYERVKAAAVRHAEERDAERAESNRLRQERDRAESAEATLARRLREVAEEAAELIGDWGSYASAYFQEKHDLQGDIDRFHTIAALSTPGTSEEKCEK